MRTDLIDWQVRQEDGAWTASAPGLGVWLEGGGGLMEVMTAAGLVEACGPPAGQQEPFSLCMDRAIHQVRVPGPDHTKAALHEAIERCAELKVIINTPGTTLAKVRKVIGATVIAARELEEAVKMALGTVPSDGGPEFSAALGAGLIRVAAAGREISAYAGAVAEPANVFDEKAAIIEPWCTLAARGDDVVLKAMNVQRGIDSLGYQYEERWLVAKLDGVYVYIAGRGGKLHVFVSKQRLKLNADRPAAVA